MLRTKFAKALAVELLGLTPPNPWLLNSGYARMRSRWKAWRCAIITLLLGYPRSTSSSPGVSRTTCWPRHRRISKAPTGFCRDRLAGRTTDLLCALPPDQKHMIGRDANSETSTTSAASGASACRRSTAGTSWCVRTPRRRSIAWARCNNMASISPIMTLRGSYPCANLRGLRVGDHSLGDRLRQAGDQLRVYQYGYRDYEGVEAVALVNTRDEFRQLLARLTTDRQFRTSMAAPKSMYRGAGDASMESRVSACWRCCAVKSSRQRTPLPNWSGLRPPQPADRKCAAVN